MKCPLLEIRNLSAWYQKDRKVLSELSLKLYENEVTGLIGIKWSRENNIF